MSHSQRWWPTRRLRAIRVSWCAVLPTQGARRGALRLGFAFGYPRSALRAVIRKPRRAPALAAIPTLDAVAPRRVPRQARSRALVDAILEAAEQLLVAKGPRAFTTPSVAALAGVSVGSLYQYFPSKHALLAALIERHAASGSAMQAETLGRIASGTLEDAVRGFVETLVGAFRANGALYGKLLSAMASVEREAFVRSELDRCVVLATMALTPHAERLSPRTPEEAAYVLTIAVNAVVRDAARVRPSLLLGETLTDDLSALCLGYLRPSAPFPCG